MTEASRTATTAIADQFGIRLAKVRDFDPVLEIARDAEFRIGQILAPASILFRKSHGAKLTADQLNMVVKSLGLRPLYGYNGTSQFETRTVVSGDGEHVIGVVDHEVALSEVAVPAPKASDRKATFSFNWVLVDGVPVERRAMRKAPRLLDCGGVRGITGLPGIAGTETVHVGDAEVVEDALASEFRGYYEHAVQSFDSEDVEVRSALEESLSRDPGIQPLLPLFLQFLAERLTSCLSDTKVVRCVALFAMALVNNPSLPVHFYAHAFLRIAMTVTLRWESGENLDDDIEVRQIGAHLLLDICERCATGFPEVRTVVLNALICGWLNPNTTHAAQFGALAGIRAFGRDAVTKIIPHVPGYMITLKREMDARKKVFIQSILQYLHQILSDEKNNVGRGEQMAFTRMLNDISSTLNKLSK